jgi:hypothetical protein
MFGGTVLMGFFAAIFILTGTNIEPTDLALMVSGKIMEATNNPQASAIWNTMVIAITIIGIVELIKDIISYIAFGWKGVVVASTGFLGTLSLFLGGGGWGSNLGIILLFVGGGICFVLEGTPPDDFIRRHLK